VPRRDILGTRNVSMRREEQSEEGALRFSSEVYGEPKVIPIPETAIRAPVSEYGVSKCVGEEYCKAYAQRFGLPYSIVRLFNVYGERQRDDFVMSVFINAALRGAPLNINAPAHSGAPSVTWTTRRRHAEGALQRQDDE